MVRTDDGITEDAADDDNMFLRMLFVCGGVSKSKNKASMNRYGCRVKGDTKPDGHGQQ